MKRSRARSMKTELEIDELLSELDIPELIALIKRISEEIELRFMEGEERHGLID